MSTLPASNDLSELIRELPHMRRTGTEAEGEIVIIETKTDEILDQAPLVNFRRVRYFEVFRNKVAFMVEGPEIALNYANADKPFRLKITYDARVSEKGMHRVVRFFNKSPFPGQEVNSMIKEHVSSYVFACDNFVINFNSHKDELMQIIREAGKKAGLDLKPYFSHNISDGIGSEVFVNFEHTVSARTSDNQVVDIKHTLALTLTDSIKFSLSEVADLEKWAKARLDQYTNNDIIDRSYADVLLNLEEKGIRNYMAKDMEEIGYTLKQLITVRGQEIEKFNFETDTGLYGNKDYATKDPSFRIGLKIIISGRLDLHDPKTKEFIKPGIDIMTSMKRDVIEFTQLLLNEKTPDECFLHIYELEGILLLHIRQELNKTYGFKDLRITIKFLETDLSKRFSLLQERSYKVDVIANFNDKVYSLWFRITDVAKDGWHRFRATNYTTAEQELSDIALMIKNGLSPLLRPDSNVSGTMFREEFNKVRHRIAKEFGLIVEIHDYAEELNLEELRYIQDRKQDILRDSQMRGLLRQAEVDDLAILVQKRQEAVKVEDEHEVRKIDEKIAAITKQLEVSRSKFLENKTGNDFIQLPKEGTNDLLESDQQECV